MEDDDLINQTTAAVLEEIIISVCKREYFQNLDLPFPSQQQSTPLATSQTSKSHDIHKQNDRLGRFLNVPKQIQHAGLPQDKKILTINNVGDLRYAENAFVCGVDPTAKDPQYSIVRSQFRGENNPFDECKDMIKNLLDTFDTETNKENCVQLHDTLSTISNSEERHKPKVFIRHSSRSNSHSPGCGITEHCLISKEINDQRYSCENFSHEPNAPLRDSESACQGLDDEIDRMVDEIISNNAELLSGGSGVSQKTNKNNSTSKLGSINPPINNPVTPGCSSNLAELNLNSTETKSTKNSNYDQCSTGSVPPGWLNTFIKRKQKSAVTNSMRARTRSDDFMYCGPLREEKKNEEDAITPCNTCLKLRRPEQASDLPLDLLYSGIVTAPGVTDQDDNSLVFVLADDIVWQKISVGTISLARLFLYLTCRLESSTLVLDCRSSSQTIVNTLFEALTIFRNNSQLIINKVLLYIDDNSKDATLPAVVKSLFECECVVLHSKEGLTQFIHTYNLPSIYGGTLDFSQAEWVQNRIVVDSFVLFCENVRHNFARETASMTSHALPETASKTQATLERHQREMAQLLDDRQITNLRDRSQRILEQLSSNGEKDSAFCTTLVETSFAAANDAIARFVRIADSRLIALEQHLLVKQFEESCEYIHSWYSNNMKVLQSIFIEMPDSFDDLRHQRSEFDEFYLNVVTEYAKYDCLLNEVEQLKAIGYLRETELTQRAKIIEEEVKELVFKMEQKKEEVEVATQMYKFVDQAYSWALEGMKFVAMLNMNECRSLEACQKMIEDFDEYMQRHPPIPESDFADVQNLCRQYGNAKCLRQCEYALQKCKETSELFQKRRELIAKIKCQFKSSNKKRLPSFRSFIGRDKDAKFAEKMKQSPNLSLSSKSFSNESNESVEKESTDGFSLDSLDDSSVFDEQNEAFSSPCSSIDPTSDYMTKSNVKPARKVLKKSLSMPGHQMAKHMVVHQSPKISYSVGSRIPLAENVEQNSAKTKVALIIRELITTEKEYVKSLNYVIENYFPEMCKLDLPQALRCKRNVIFGNIEKIADFHSRSFLRELEKCNENPLLVAKTFQSHKESFGLYALYSKNKPQSDMLLQEHGNEFFKTKQLELEDKMDLASYLLKPVQRMGKYALLLHAMSKQCSPSEERSLKEAEELVKFQLRHGNDLLTMDSIQNCDVNLKEQGNLLRQEQFVIYTSRRKIIRRVFLFEDLVLFSKPIHVHGGHDVYQYKCSYKTAEIGMTENIGDTGCKFEIWFRRRRSQTTQDTYILQSSTRSIKRAWVEEIRGLLWEQALRNRNHRKDEMSSMGVGNKPHLDLTASSKNRITDRSVITTPPGDRSFLTNRYPRSRTRVSIAVPSFDHVQQQSKRPHSTISTSSSTSSVGSGNNQSMSLVSSLNLASWPSKSDGRSLALSPPLTFSPPMAYFDFHAIAEDLNEDCESNSGSSVTMSRDESTEMPCQSPLTKQYVTTV